MNRLFELEQSLKRKSKKRSRNQFSQARSIYSGAMTLAGDFRDNPSSFLTNNVFKFVNTSISSDPNFTTFNSTNKDYTIPFTKYENSSIIYDDDSKLTVLLRPQKTTKQFQLKKYPSTVFSMNIVKKTIRDLRGTGSITDYTIQSQQVTVPSSDTSETLGNAYYLPWEDNKACSIRLGNNANYFFTPELSGCAIFIYGNAANPLVVHANYQPSLFDISTIRSTDVLEASQIMDNIRYSEQDAFYKIMGYKMREDSTYFTAGSMNRILFPLEYIGQTFVFGIRKNNAWSFYRYSKSEKSVTRII